MKASPQIRGAGRARRLRRWAMVGLVLGLAVWLRLDGLAKVPAPMATADEYSYVWTGMSLLETGVPTSWSDLVGYRGDHALGWTQLEGNPFHLVRPYLDHPPLYGLLVGLAARLDGARPVTVTTNLGRQVRLWEFNIGDLRLLSVALFGLSFLFLYDLAARRFGQATALLALAIYAVDSQIVLHSRLIVTEALSTPLLLGGLCACDRYRLGRWSEGRFALVTVLTIAAAALTKVVAVAQAGAVLYLVLLAGRRRAAWYPALGVVLGVALYLGYAWWQGFGVFVEVMRAQGARFYGFAVVRSFLAHQQLVQAPEFNYPLLVGWIAFFAAPLIGGLRGRGLFGAGLLYLLGFAFFTAVPAIYGWHVLPFYPFLALALAAVAMEVWRRGSLTAHVAGLALMLPEALDILFQAHPAWAEPLRLAYLGLTGAAVVLPFYAPRQGRRLLRTLLAASLALILIGQIMAVVVADRV